MIHELSGDILLSQANAIAHGVAPNDHFDAGLALALRERWPSMAKDFRHWAHAQHPKPGALFAWRGPEGAHIVSLLTQEGAIGANTRPEAATLPNVNHALRALKQYARDQGLTSLALPRLATGVGGLDWKDVQPLVREHLGALEIPVYVYTTYRPDVRATEPA